MKFVNFKRHDKKIVDSEYYNMYKLLHASDSTKLFAIIEVRSEGKLLKLRRYLWPGKWTDC